MSVRVISHHRHCHLLNHQHQHKHHHQWQQHIISVRHTIQPQFSAFLLFATTPFISIHLICFIFGCVASPLEVLCPSAVRSYFHAVPRDLKTVAKLNDEVHMKRIAVMNLINKTLVPGMNFGPTCWQHLSWFLGGFYMEDDGSLMLDWGLFLLSIEIKSFECELIVIETMSFLGFWTGTFFLNVFEGSVATRHLVEHWIKISLLQTFAR